MRADLDEPVRRYLTHALGDGGAPTAMRLTMSGRIDAGRWLDFTAEQEFHEHAFSWRCRAGWGRFKPFQVADRYADGAGSSRVKLLGAIPVLRQGSDDTARSAAGRAAAESVWVPATLRDVPWRAEADDVIVATLDVPPERPELTLRIDAQGALRSVSLLRWGNVGRPEYGYIPFGAEIHAESRYGEQTLPSRVTVGWEFGTPSFKPFYEATILTAEPLTR